MRIFEKISTAQKKAFLSLVHAEWNEDFTEIEKFFSPKIFVAILDKKVVAGLTIFEKSAPETEDYPELADKLFSENFFYLGHFVVDQKLRGKGIGSKFLQKFLQKFPKQKFWLSIENPLLRSFYEKNGFMFLAEKIIDPSFGKREWIFIKNRNHCKKKFHGIQYPEFLENAFIPSRIR